MKKARKKRMSIASRIGMALIIAGAGFLILSADPYTMDVITTKCFLSRMFWSFLLMGAGMSLCQ